MRSMIFNLVDRSILFPDSKFHSYNLKTVYNILLDNLYSPSLITINISKRSIILTSSNSNIPNVNESNIAIFLQFYNNCFSNFISCSTVQYKNPLWHVFVRLKIIKDLYNQAMSYFVDSFLVWTVTLPILDSHKRQRQPELRNTRLRLNFRQNNNAQLRRNLFLIIIISIGAIHEYLTQSQISRQDYFRNGH